jgi:hypothetical protein
MSAITPRSSPIPLEMDRLVPADRKEVLRKRGESRYKKITAFSCCISPPFFIIQFFRECLIDPDCFAWRGNPEKVARAKRLCEMTRGKYSFPPQNKCEIYCLAMSIEPCLNACDPKFNRPEYFMTREEREEYFSPLPIPEDLLPTQVAPPTQFMS